ncbi:MAG TPA: hypothetical protein DEP35_07600 [Deltaproteobacteria bacterium]|nr:hypothetical protein [Deltaproteobacteria bacterium]
MPKRERHPPSLWQAVDGPLAAVQGMRRDVPSRSEPACGCGPPSPRTMLASFQLLRAIWDLRSAGAPNAGRGGT